MEAKPEAEGPKTIAFEAPDGSKHNLSPHDLLYLAQRGYDSIQSPAPTEPEPEPEPEDLSDSEKLDKINKEFTDFKQEQQAKETNQQVLMSLDQLTGNAAFVKEYPAFTDTLKLNTVVRQRAGDGRPIQSIFAEELKRLQDAVKTVEDAKEEKMKANGKAWNKLNNMSAAGGGMPQLETEHKFTPEDVKSGRSQNDIAQIITALRGH